MNVHVRGAVRRLQKTSNCAFQCDYHHCTMYDSCNELLISGRYLSCSTNLEKLTGKEVVFLHSLRTEVRINDFVPLVLFCYCFVHIYVFIFLWGGGGGQWAEGEEGVRGGSPFYMYLSICFTSCVFLFLIHL